MNIDKGRGNVIRSMFKDIEADCYLMIDGDDTYPAENAREMCESCFRRKSRYGYRRIVFLLPYFTENKRPFHNLGNRLVRGLINKLFKSNVRDIMTGYRAFSYEFVKTFPVLSKGFEIETENDHSCFGQKLFVKRNACQLSRIVRQEVFLS